MQFIDSHFHADLMDKAEGGIPGVLDRMRDAEVRGISIGTQKDDWPVIRDLSRKHPDLLAYTMGLHPSEVREDWKTHIAALEKALSSDRPCGIGEIGLDYYRLAEDPHPHDTLAWQKAAFEAQLSILKASGLPCVIHSRGENAYRDIIEIINKSKADWTKFVFHCFSEGPAEIRELNARGGRASFTGIITFKNGQKMRDALLAQDPKLLMVETDAPFLSPEPHRGKVNDPSRVPLVAAKAAEILQAPLESMAKSFFQTTIDFFRLVHWAGPQSK